MPSLVCVIVMQSVAMLSIVMPWFYISFCFFGGWNLCHRCFILIILSLKGAVTLSIMKPSITTLNVSIKTQYSAWITFAIQHFVALFWGSLRWVPYFYCYADCHYAECHYAEGRYIVSFCWMSWHSFERGRDVAVTRCILTSSNCRISFAKNRCFIFKSGNSCH